MKTIILKVNNKGLFYNEEACIDWKNTNLPSNDFLFYSHTDIYWEVELISFDKNEKKLFINIQNYNSSQLERFKKQQAKLPINSISIKALSEKQFKAQLSYYKLDSLNQFWTEEEEIYTPTHQRVKLSPFEDSQQKNTFNPQQTRKIIQIIQKEKLMNTTFGLGVVKLSPFIEEIGYHLEMVIENDFIVPEFNHIKAYFSKALKTKKITIRATIELEGKDIKSIRARSEELEKINDDLIQIVRSIAIEQAIEKPVVMAIDKSLFTGDELFDNFQEENIGDVFDRSDDELLKEILALKGVRNAKQLQYLAGKLHESNIKLRFSLSPLFGFLFLVKGEQRNHYIWELLNSNATYIWSFDKDNGSIEKQFKEVEKILSYIRENGRQSYRQNYLNEGIHFQLITHEQVNSKLVNSFPKWKNRLLEKLI